MKHLWIWLAFFIANVISSPTGHGDHHGDGCSPQPHHNECVPARRDRPLINGDFEGHSLDPWKVTTIPGNYYPYGIVRAGDNFNFTSGHMFWARNNVSLTGDIEYWDHFYVILKQNITTCPGRNYTFSGNYFIPPNNVLYPLFKLGPRDEDVVDGHYALKVGDVRGVWSNIKGNFVAKGPKVEITAGFDSRNMMNDGDWYMDRIVVRPS